MKYGGLEFLPEDEPYIKENPHHKGEYIPLFGLYSDEPTEREIFLRKYFRKEWCKDTTATVQHPCPVCKGMNTEQVRIHSFWNICYDCEIAFDHLEWYNNPDELEFAWEHE